MHHLEVADRAGRGVANRCGLLIQYRTLDPMAAHERTTHHLIAQ